MPPMNARVAAAMMFLLLLSTTALAGRGSADDIDPFADNALGVEFSIGPFVEAWNLNNKREWLVQGTASIWWTFRPGLMLVNEFDVMRIFQNPGRNAFVQAFSPLVRWRALDRPGWDLFLEAGPGISWSDTTVPPGGTRVNYLAVASAGTMRRLGRQSQAVLGVRWIHLSNNSLDGRGRNPDINALGGFAGVSVTF
jgi:hypothetical protein